MTAVGQGAATGTKLAGDGANCQDCVWRLVPLCVYRTPDAPGADPFCLSAVAMPACAARQVAYAVYLSTAADPSWREVDVICSGPDAGLLPTAAIAPALDTAFAKVPLPHTPVTVQPPNGAVVALPAIFRTDKPTPAPVPTVAQAGPVTATLTITATIDHYVWHFGDGTTRQTTSAGAPYADNSTVPAEGDGDPYVTHTYPRAGIYAVTVDAIWTGSYVFAGSATGTLTQTRTTTSAPVQLTVSAARSQLVSR